MNKFKEILFEKKITSRIISIILNLLPLVLTLSGVLFLSYKESSIFEKISFEYVENVMALVAVVLTMIYVVVGITSAVKGLNRKKVSIWLPIAEIIMLIALFVVGKSFDLFGAFSFVLFVLSIVLAIMNLVYSFFAAKHVVEEDNSNEGISVDLKKNYFITLIINCISSISLISIFFTPLYSGYTDGMTKTFIILNGMSGTTDLPLFITFIVMFVLFVISIGYLLNTLKYYFWKDKRFSKTAKTASLFNFILAMLFFIAGNTIVFIFSRQGTYTNLSTLSYIPFILLSLVTIVHSFFNARNDYITAKVQLKKSAMGAKWMILLFIVIFTVITIATSLMDLISVSAPEIFTGTVHIRGIDLLLHPDTNGEGWQVVSFLVFAIILLSIVMLVLSVTAIFTRNGELKRIGLASIIMNFIFVVALGLFGKYYEMSSLINAEYINSYIKEHYGFSGIIAKDYIKVKSSCFYMIFADVLAAICLFIFKPFTKADMALADAEIEISNSNDALKVELVDKEVADIKKELASGSAVDSAQPDPVNKTLKPFDACPAFTELDELKEEFDAKLEERRLQLFENPTLPQLVSFIVNYAKESRLHLSYTEEDIAAFVAGLGATKLSILQGMSGTGKTSLPKIFLEAIMGNCEIIEVESSWKDKNELLGYYNEFSKSFTPKKFTRALYKASLNSDIVTFIVLDEMNLSRIEYYFSDFLSLMENEADKREIQLCNVKLYNTYDNVRHNYLGLKNGHTIHIPENIWFIGTANRDESTFEISDKVYDRAHTMNFNKRAPKVRNYTEPIPQKYLTYGAFQSMINNAKANGTFDLESVSFIKDIEELLRPYNISFGNRIMNQIEDYVKVYQACFNNSEDVVFEALEKILLSKVVAKLEFKAVEDKETLVHGFEKMKLYKCAEFVKGLNEDF